MLARILSLAATISLGPALWPPPAKGRVWSGDSLSGSTGRPTPATNSEHQDHERLEELVRALGHEDGTVRTAAAAKLGRLGDPRALGPLLRTLQDRNPDVRLAAAKALAGIGRPAVGPLVQALHQQEARVREVAAWALGRIRDARVVQPLIRALSDEDVRVREAAAHALAWLFSSVTSALGDRDDQIRTSTMAVIGKLGNPRVLRFLSKAARDPDEDVRQAALGAHHRFYVLLFSALEAPDAQVRRSAAEALGRLGDPRAVRPLGKALGDEEPDVRRTAAEALGKLADPRAVEPLVALLRDGAPDVASAAARALLKIGEPAAGALLEVLVDRHGNLLEAAAGVLIRIGEPLTAAAARALKGNRDAAQVLVRARHNRLWIPFLRALKSSNPALRRAAEAALAQVVDEWNPSASSALLAEALQGPYPASLVSAGAVFVVLARSKLRRGLVTLLYVAPHLLARSWALLASLVVSFVLSIGIRRFVVRSLRFGAVLRFLALFTASLPVLAVTVPTMAALTRFSLLAVAFLAVAWASVPWLAARPGANGTRRLAVGAVVLLLVQSCLVMLADGRPWGSLVHFSNSLVLAAAGLGSVAIWRYAFPYLALAASPVLGRWWREAEKAAKGSLCKSCLARFQAASPPPFTVRWTGRWLFQEEPMEHEAFTDYFRCRKCSQVQGWKGVEELVGQIGGDLADTAWDGERVYAQLWRPEAKGRNRIRDADVDTVEIYGHIRGRVLSADELHEACRLLVGEFLEDPFRGPDYFKTRRVRLVGKPTLRQETRLLLKSAFGQVEG